MLAFKLNITWVVDDTPIHVRTAIIVNKLQYTNLNTTQSSTKQNMV